MNEQNNSQALSSRQEGIVIIAAFTAKGNLPQLKGALNQGLDAGLTINEIKEALVQLYAYCGFPRSLNGIITLMAVLDERKALGINDIIGKEASPIEGSGNKYETGKKTLEVLTKRIETGPKTGLTAFAPVIDTFLKEHLFADIFGRGVLTYVERELTTISALTSLGGVEAQLQAHLGMGLNVGITKSQLKQIFNLIETNIGKSEADIGKGVLANILVT